MRNQVQKATIGHQQLHTCKLQTVRSGSSQGRVTGSWAVPSGQHGLPDKRPGPAVLSVKPAHSVAAADDGQSA